MRNPNRILTQTRTLHLIAALVVGACNENYVPEAPERDASVPQDGGSDGSGDSGSESDAGVPPVFGGMTVNSTPAEQDIDLLGKAGHRFWVQVSSEQLARMNGQNGGGGGPIFDRPAGDVAGPGGMGPEPGGGGGDIYTPGISTYADHVVVQDDETKSVADYGRIEVKLVGESTGRQWGANSIPNLRFDMDEYQQGLRLGGIEHFRLNNGVVGSIYRELIAHRIYRALGYPGLRGTFATLGSNVWGEDVSIPMVLIEVYKRKFCENSASLLGGTCVNIWEFAGDAGTVPPPAEACQYGDCTSTKMDELAMALASAPQGEGFKEALAPVIDWGMFHKFQCLSWILSTGDDAIHNGNNNLIIERDDGKLVFAPYSVDISAGQSWYPNTRLYGTSSIAVGCQKDPVCWSDAIAACREVVSKFDALNPETIVDEVHATLKKHDMLRKYDEERAVWIREWYVARQEGLAEELEYYAEPPGEDGCPESLMVCSDQSCGTEEQCSQRCGVGQAWCSEFKRCIQPGSEFCPDCSDEVPFFCNVNGECLASVDECSAACGEGRVYCDVIGGCIEVGSPCGGRPVPID